MTISSPQMMAAPAKMIVKGSAQTSLGFGKWSAIHQPTVNHKPSATMAVFSHGLKSRQRIEPGVYD